MKGIIVNFRGSHKTQDNSCMIIKVDGINSKEKAKTLINKNLIWTTASGKKINGKIIRIHGNKGAVRAKFEVNLPGQSLSTHVDIE